MVRCELNQEQFEAAAAQLRDKEGIGLDAAQRSGEIEKNGVKASWSFNGSELLLSVTHHPFLVSAKFCEGEIAASLVEHGLTASVVG